MGSFFVNYQIRGNSAAVVVKAMQELAQSRAYVSPSNNGWITVYDQASDSQDNNEINRLAGDLSSRLGTALFAFLVHDSDVFAYYLYDNGDLIDEYNSRPGYFGEMVSDEARQRLAGQPAVVLNHCAAGTTLVEVETAMGWSQHLGEGGFASSVFAEDRLRPLAAALGIDEVRALLGYNYFEEERRSLPDGDQFTAINGQKSAKPKRGPVPPRLPPRS
jgi:hypothetical protein